MDQVLPRGLQGSDRLRGRLPRGGVQERSEGQDQHRPRLRRQPGRSAAAAGPARADAGDPTTALVLPDSSTAALGGAWTRLAAPAVLADASASTVPADL